MTQSPASRALERPSSLSKPRRGGMRRRCGLVLLAMTALAACADPNGERQSLPVSAEHPVTVDPQVLSVQVSADDASDLTSAELAGVAGFVREYHRRGDGAITVAVPVGGTNAGVAATRARKLSRALTAAGAPPDAVQITGYRAYGHNPPLLLTYQRWVASATPCVNSNPTMLDKSRNLHSANFGCATQGNMAVMVANPRDLREAQPFSPASARWSHSRIEKNRAGESSASAAESAPASVDSSAGGG